MINWIKAVLTHDMKVGIRHFLSGYMSTEPGTVVHISIGLWPNLILVEAFQKNTLHQDPGP